MKHIKTFEDTASLNEALAIFIDQDIKNVLAQKPIYTFVLSGGSTPKQLFRILANEPYKNSIPWEKIHFFWGDERFVPYNDERNNAKMAFDELLSLVPVRPDQVHRMQTELSPAEAVADYTQVLKGYFKETGPTFDLVLLGMGEDGHTLSLFPGTEVIEEKDKWVDSYFLEPQQMVRITLTAPIVNRAATVAFALAGAGKAPALKEVLEGPPNRTQYPSQIINPERGNLLWFIDKNASSLLSKA
ncbi:6-phosphogluconolactonase [Dyadobacter jejuensis]|uniref:6-phosphogluconolactonase n=1 Tax=Dyadobacter jejuensis TaxID=1082580 RepID=A0A316ANV8_9BACT|nr:6-phosphogluconolactonase [Dyadobacter jejuensis]PWJ58480.1 6-phosphogluconolactonase [Dyadobacter jejuensis]